MSRTPSVLHFPQPAIHKHFSAQVFIFYFVVVVVVVDDDDDADE